jgi:hypothetical protein
MNPASHKAKFIKFQNISKLIYFRLSLRFTLSLNQYKNQGIMTRNKIKRLTETVKCAG